MDLNPLDDKMGKAQCAAPDERKEVQKGYVLMPDRLTSENGAKSLFMGEFKESIEVTCPDCDGADDDFDCHACENTGRVSQDVMVGWDTIKEIYKLAVQHLSIAAQPAKAEADQAVAAEPSAHEQKLAERVGWTVKQWYEHVGAWENSKDEITFGSVMALRAMMLQFQSVTSYATKKRIALAPQPATPAPAMGEELPPPKYPKMRMLSYGKVSECAGYTADQMHAYGRACMALRQPAEKKDPHEKGLYWFSCLVKCARLLGLTDDEPIPSSVVAAVERLTAAPAQPVAAQAGPVALDLIVRDIAELDYSSDTVLDMIEVSEIDLRAIIARHSAPPPVPAVAPLDAEGMIVGLRKVYAWMEKLPVPTTGIIPTMKRLRGVIHQLESGLTVAECSKDPANCPNNEGYGCDCTPSAPVGGSHV
jgi:hypothetical protein